MATTVWNKDFTQVAHEGKVLSLPKMRLELQEAILEAKKLMSELEMGHHIPVKVPADFIDDMANMDFDYSYDRKVKCIPEFALLRAILYIFPA